jgi:hypothetical protein
VINLTEKKNIELIQAKLYNQLPIHMNFLGMSFSITISLVTFWTNGTLERSYIRVNRTVPKEDKTDAMIPYKLVYPWKDNLTNGTCVLWIPAIDFGL